MVNVIYIAGYGRSGSTLIDLILGQLGALSLGEVRYLEKHKNENTICSCGSKIKDCAMWSSIYVADKGLECKKHLDVLLQVIDNNKDYSTFVDSSKTARGAYFRPIFLSNALSKHSIAFLVVHVVRDPVSVYRSLVKGSNETLAWGTRKRNNPVLSGLVGWYLANIAATIYKYLYKNKYIIIKYEDVVDRKCDFKMFEDCGLKLDKLSDVYLGKVMSVRGHTVGGNRMSRETNVKLNKEHDATEKKPIPMLIRLLLLPGRKFYAYI